MMLARLRGARVISTDIVGYRCDLARELGAHSVFNDHEDDVAAAIMDLTGGRGVDKVIECVGSDQDETIGQIVRLRLYAGLSIMETAEVLGISRATVNRRWEYARTWLFRELEQLIGE